MHGIGQDIRYALRGMRKAPGFFLIAVLTLGLGIGATAAIFSIINAVLLRPLPYGHPEQLVSMQESNPRRGLPVIGVSPGNFLDWSQEAKSFNSMSAVEWRTFNFTGNDGAIRIEGAMISPNLLQLLQQPLLLGRGFQQSEAQPGSNSVILIGENLWRRQFAGDRGILGKTVRMSGQSFTIIGVLPAPFHFPFPDTEVWQPLAFSNADLANRADYRLQVVARLRQGVSLFQARTEMESIARRLEHDYPEANAGVSVRVQDFHEAQTGGSHRLIFTLFGAVLAILIIACLNIAGLLSVRFVGRQHEMALRTSLGATRSRLIRQFLTESVLLGCFGGILGLMIAKGGLSLLLHFIPFFSTPATPIAIDVHVLLFAIGLSILCGILFGAAPAWQNAHANPVDGLREGGRSATGSRALRKLQTGFVVGEIGLSLVSLVVAGLLMRSFMRMLNIDPGFRTKHVLVNTLLVLPTYKYPENYQRIRFFDSLLGKIKQMPGVVAAGGITSLPLQSNSSFIPIRIEGRPTAPDGKLMAAVFNVVTPGYFTTMQIPLRRGRWFSDDDSEHSPRVAVINDVAANKLFAGTDPVGQRVYLSGQGEQPFTVVGIVGSCRQFDITSPPSAEIFANYQQSSMSYMYVLARTTGDPRRLIPAIRHAVAEIDPEQPVGHRTLAQQLDNAVSGDRLYTLLMGLFAGLALLLAAVGVYGAMSYAVSQRTQEIGVRMALGAHRRHVLALFLMQGGKVALLGVGIGLVLAFAACRVIANMLFDIRPTDAVAFSGAALLLIVTVLISNYVPARRATRVDPLLALRNE